MLLLDVQTDLKVVQGFLFTDFLTAILKYLGNGHKQEDERIGFKRNTVLSVVFILKKAVLYLYPTLLDKD